MKTRLDLRPETGWRFAAGGIALAAVGLLALAYPVTATAAVETALGIVLIIAGAAQMIHGLRARRWPGRWLVLWLGLVLAIVGAYLLTNPRAVALGLAVIIGATLLVVAFVKFTYAMWLRAWRGALWLALAGALSLFLGAWIIARSPTAGNWLVGALVGADLAVTGAWLAVFGVAVRRGALHRPHAPAVEAAAIENQEVQPQ